MARDSEVLLSSSQDLLQDWLLDYVYHLALDEFTKEGTVDNAFNRDFIQGLLNCVTSRDPKASAESYQMVNKLFTMCCVADGEATEEDDDDGTLGSKLELLLSISPQLNDIFGDAVFSSWSCSIKRQAVFVSWRNGDFDLANDIFSRIFTGQSNSSEDSKVKDEVNEVLKSEDMFHVNLQKYPFKDLLKETAAILQQLEPEKQHVPTLQHMLQNHLTPRAEHSPKEQLSVGCQTDLPLPGPIHHVISTLANGIGCQSDLPLGPLPDVNLTSEFTHLTKHTKLSHLEGKPYRLPSKWRHKFANRVKDIAKNRDFYVQNMPSFDNRDGDSNTEEVPVRKETTEENSDLDVIESSPVPSPKVKARRNSRSDRNGKGHEHKTKALKRRRDAETTVTSSTTSENNNNNNNKRSRGLSERVDVKGDLENTDEDSGLSEDDAINGKKETESTLRIKLPPTVHLRRSLAPTGPSRQTSKYFSRGQRIPWTKKEEEKLYKAIQECGVGNWSEMLGCDGSLTFPQRTNVHLKDKWRTMQKNGRANELRAKYGPV